MSEIKSENLTYKGTRILFGDTALKKRQLLNSMSDILIKNGYSEMMIPIIQFQETFASKVGDENRNMMFNFKDRGDRDITLSPEYTSVIIKLSKDYFKFQKDIKLFYIGECFRGERPQNGRYRQFTQFGVEVINPSKDYSEEMLRISKELVELVTKNYEVNTGVARGLDYYSGWTKEISCPELGAAKQVCGSGSYEGGIGYAVGVDRLLLCK